MGNEFGEFYNMLIKPIVDGVINICRNPLGRILVLVFGALYLIQLFFEIPCFDKTISAIVWIGKTVWSLVSSIIN